MNRMKLFILALFIFLLFVQITLGVVFATNTIFLYENGNRVTDSSVIYGEYNYDPVCYMFGITYENMPIAVGERHFIEGAMSEIYSNFIGKQVNTKLAIV